MINKIVFLTTFLIISIAVFSQKELTIKLRKDKSVLTTPVSSFSGFRKTRTGYYSEKGLFFQITLIDNNFNKRFNDLDIDEINIEHEKAKSIRFHQGVSFAKIRDSNFIKTENKTFKITYIDSLGNFLRIIETDISPSHSVNLVNKLPNINFKLINDSVVNFRDFIDGEKYIYVEFWGSWCKGCLQVLPRIKEVFNSHSDDVIVIYLNSRDAESEVREFVKENNLNWVNGFATEIIEKEFLQNGYPFGVLFNNRGEAIKFRCRSVEFEEFMNSLEK